jgi:hypothetical protein
MKITLSAVVILFSATLLLSQDAQYLTHNSMMKIKAGKKGESVEWQNDNVSVRLDYRTGEFITYLSNTDFMKPGEDAGMIKESEIQKRQLTFSGTLPISDIINQQQSTQNYKVELNLETEDLDLSETILFDMLITKPESANSKSYRMFTLNGILYNDQTNLPAFSGYDNEIQLWLIFTGFMNVQ